MTVTASINRALPEVALASLLVLVGLIAYRVVRILMTLVVNAAVAAGGLDAIGDGPESALRRMAEFGIVGAAVEFALALVLIALRLLMAAVRSLLMITYALAPFVFVSALLALAQVDWYESVAVLTDAFDGPLSDTLHTLLLMPLQLLGEVGPMVLPMYNLLVYAFVQFPLQFLIWLFKGAGAYQLLQAVGEVRDLFPALARAAQAFVAANAAGCPSLGACVSSVVSIQNASMTECVYPTPATLASGCLNPAGRELDLVPAFTHVQQAASYAIVGLGASCQTLSTLLNATLYPIADPSLWYAADRAINAALQALVVAPILTMNRCTLAGGFAARPAMCTPDLGPAFDRAVDAVLSLGDVVTHWFDAVWVLLFDQVCLGLRRG